VASGGDVLIHAGGDAVFKGSVDASGGGLGGVGGAVGAVEVVVRDVDGTGRRGDERRGDAGVEMLDGVAEERVGGGLQRGLAGGDVNDGGVRVGDFLGVGGGGGEKDDERGGGFQVFTKRVVSNVLELGCVIVSVADAVFVVASVPDFTWRLLTDREGVSAFDELYAAGRTLVDGWGDENVGVIRHDGEAV